MKAPKPLQRIQTRRVRVAKGLTRMQAMQVARKKSPGDFRGFTYDPETGFARLT